MSEAHGSLLVDFFVFRVTYARSAGIQQAQVFGPLTNATALNGPGSRRTMKRMRFAWRALSSVLLLSIVVPISGFGSTPDLSASMAAELRRQDLQGAVWSTVLTDSTVTLGAAGIKDASVGTRINVEDRVQVGSVAKTLIAAGILRLATEGRLTLDARVTDLVSGIRFDNPWSASDPIRVRHLLDHTAGLDDARIAHIFSKTATADMPLAWQ